MYPILNRRQFVRSALLGTTACAAGLQMPIPAMAGVGDPVLAHVMMFGGADLRWVFAPDPHQIAAAGGNMDIANEYWLAREILFTNMWNGGVPGVPAAYADYEAAYDDHYLPVANEGFGIHKSCGWLHSEYLAGNVAIVANADGSNNRRHDHSQLIMLTGDLGIGINDYDTSGWGGELCEYINNNGGLVPDDPSTGSTTANAVAMTTTVPIFCYGENGVNRLEHVVHTPNTTAFGFNPGSGNASNYQQVMSRAIEAYYGVKGAEVAADPTKQTGWPFSLFYQHEASIRSLQGNFNAVIPGSHPANISALYSSSKFSNPPGPLWRTSFGRQIANLYDCLFAADVLGMRVAHLDYGGWDTHDGQQVGMQRNLHDLFGVGGGLNTLQDEADTSNLVTVFNSDFGRQIMGNGTAGTDHGNGTYLIVHGAAVTGGVYGEMFPVSELPTSTASDSRYDIARSGIAGRTSIEEVFKELCDWVSPIAGAGAAVFPNADGSTLEDGPLNIV